MIVKEPIMVRCDDGVDLKGVLIIPPAPKAVVQFNGGTGTKKEFYLPFLEFLAQDGFLCCLWDYRGSGESAPADLKTCAYRFLDYGRKDMPAVKNYLTNRFPTLPYLLVGHSVGGQQVGFMDNLAGTKGMLGFAVSTGYLAYMPISYRWLAAYFFHLFTPLSIKLTGYVAAKKFGIMEDLPREVAREWKAWCGQPDYFFNARFYGKTVPRGNFKNYNFPIHMYWTSDDPISNHRSVPAFWNQVENQSTTHLHQIEPTDYRQKKIAHFGFFKKSMRDQLWPEALQKLNSFLH